MAITSGANFPGVMRIGDIVTASIQLFRTHFQKYYLTTLQGFLWVMVPDLISRVIRASFPLAESSLFRLAANLILLYFWANYFAGVSVMYRTAFNELISRTEEEKQIRSAVFAKKWSLLWVNIPGLLMFAALGLPLVLVIVLGKALSLPRETQGLLFLGTCVVLGISFVGLLWALTRFSFAYYLLILEDMPSVVQSLKRSWLMTKGSVLRLQAIYSLGLLIVAPFIGLDAFVSHLIHQHISQPWLAIPLGMAETLLIEPIYVALLGIVGVFAYSDLISRREGADLSLPLHR